MKFTQSWTGAYVRDNERGDFFPASVPGNIQLDYARVNGFEDAGWSDNCTKFKPLEDYGWIYQTNLDYTKQDGERVYFVSLGIEYACDIFLNSKKICHHTGMFSKIEVDITDALENGNMRKVYIYPHPKRPGADECRDQADQSCKPAVQYGWDWHPRLLVSGIWNDTYVETRNADTIVSCDHTYTLSEDLNSADIAFDIVCNSETVIELYDMEDRLVHKGSAPLIHLDHIKLWWCSGQGTPYLYQWKITSPSDSKTGFIGFRKVRLVMNGGAWDEPSEFPKSRSTPPVTIELNGREIFGKGSNWVNPELFTGTITKETYERQLKLVKDANMNILRCWGGAIVNKESFFELCDQMGIMIWQEFPLACNNYVGTDSYLRILEQEAIAIINRVKQHPCLVLWCGGNELFNNWSKMTDQSHALRLLNKLCYDYDRNTPFIMTSPLMGMAHGSYIFYDPQKNETVFETLRQSKNTAYTEFGTPSITELEHIKKVIPEEYLEHPAPNTPWELHHGYGSWEPAGKDSWLCFDLLDIVFGKQDSLEAYIEKSIWLQCEGLTCIFEEARRQKPNCSLALNWCLNEPWITVAGQSLVTYPAYPKKAYYAVKDALRPVLPSARIEHFRYTGGDTLVAELWLLNDSPKDVEDTIHVFFEIDGQKKHVITWNTGIVKANTNKKGHKVQIALPLTGTQKTTLHLEASCGNSAYTLLLTEAVKSGHNSHALNV